jgi:hypothetical protein
MWMVGAGGCTFVFRLLCFTALALQRYCFPHCAPVRMQRQALGLGSLLVADIHDGYMGAVEEAEQLFASNPSYHQVDSGQGRGGLWEDRGV